MRNPDKANQLPDEMFTQEFARLQPMVSKPAHKKKIREIEISEIFSQMASKLKDRKKDWIIILRLFDDTKEIESHFLEFSKGQYSRLHDTPNKFDLEIFVHIDTWYELTSGGMSPMEAYHDGKVRIRAAKLGLAKEFFKSFVKPEDEGKVVFVL